MSIANLLAPDARLLVGVEDDPDGTLRVYVDARHTGIHSHVADPDAKEAIRQAWESNRQHQSITIPTAALCDCLPPTIEHRLTAGGAA